MAWSVAQVGTPPSRQKPTSARALPVDAGGWQGGGRAQATEKLALGPAYQNREFVFCREDGTPIWPRTFSRTFERLSEDAGLPRIRLHDMRHTHATLALQAGVHPKVISERLGHASIAITLDTYSHAIPAMQEDAAATVAALID